MNRSAPAVLLLLALACPSFGELAPAAYAPVLVTHGLRAEDLPARGFAFLDGECLPVDASGAPTGPALTPAQLDAALRKAAIEALKAPPNLPSPRIPDLSGPPDAGRLGELFDGARRGEAPVLGPGSGADAPPLTPFPRFAEPDFDDSWTIIRRRLMGKQTGSGLKRLAERFQPDADSPTGLRADAPEALRLLATTLMARKGGDAAVAELNRQLKTVAYLTLEQKQAFAKELRSPLPVYVALSFSHMPHYTDAGLYFARMKELLKEPGISVEDYLRDLDPKGRYTQSFALRLNVYDLLMPHLARNPDAAAVVADSLFAAGRPDLVRKRSHQIQGVGAQLPAYAGPRASRSFAGRLRSAALSDDPVARQAALFLAMNADGSPAMAAAASDTASVLPAGLLDDGRLTPLSPDAAWPQGPVAIRMHFPHPVNFASWLSYFSRRGYTAVETSTGGVTLEKEGAARAIRLTAMMYAGDEEGYLKEDEKRRFLKNVAADLKDPAVHGIVVRTHAQFHYPAMFRGKVSMGKFWLDGSCRGAWYQEELERLCPTCKPVTNTGTGMSEITNPVLYEILEGFAEGDDWAGIHARLKKKLPKASTRLLGPWSPPYGKALDLLKKARKPSLPPPASSSR